MKRKFSKADLFVIGFMTFGILFILLAYRKRELKKGKFKAKKSVNDLDVLNYDKKEQREIKKLVRKYSKKINRAGSLEKVDCFKDEFNMEIGEIPTSVVKLAAKKISAVERAHRKALVHKKGRPSRKVKKLLKNFTKHVKTAKSEEEVKTAVRKFETDFGRLKNVLKG